MLRVAMIADYPDSEDVIDGGVQAVTHYLVRAMSEIKDIDLHVVSFRSNMVPTMSHVPEGFTRHVLPEQSLGALTAYKRSQKSLNSLLKELQPDIVHGQGVGHDGIIVARCKFPHVLTVHGILQEETRHLPTLRARARHRLQNELSKYYCIRSARNTILISPYVGDYWGKTLSGIRHMIPNPIDASFFDIKRAAEPGRILYAGRLRSLKGVHDLIDAAAKLELQNGLRVILAGSIAEKEYVADLNRKIEQHQLTQHVEIKGLIDLPSMRDELSRASVLVLPSYQETAPMVIQEAMASGVPVIASNVGGVKYQLIDGKTGFIFEPGDTDTLAEKLATLLSSQRIQDQFSISAREHALRHFQAASVAMATVDVYRKILAAI